MNLRDQLVREEGSIAHAYQDSLGYWTIGVGRLIDARKGGRLRQSEIDLLLDNDIADVRQSLTASLPWVATLSEPRQAVLIGMAFQMGVVGVLAFTQTLAAVRDAHYDHAALLMLQSQWAKQTPERAQRLSRQMASNEWN